MRMSAKKVPTRQQGFTFKDDGLLLIVVGAIVVYGIFFLCVLALAIYAFCTEGKVEPTLVGGLLSAGAIGLSALCAVFMARRTISNQRQVSRKNLTVEIILTRIWDKDFIDARNRFNAAKRSREGIEFWGDTVHHDAETTAAVRDILNDYEILAIAVDQDVMDKPIYEKWFKTGLVADYEACRSFISIVQAKEGKKYFVEFKKLAHKWADELGKPEVKQELTVEEIDEIILKKRLSWLDEKPNK